MVLMFSERRSLYSWVRRQIDACIMCPMYLSAHPIAAAALEADSGRRLLWRGARSGE